MWMLALPRLTSLALPTRKLRTRDFTLSSLSFPNLKLGCRRPEQLSPG